MKWYLLKYNLVFSEPSYFLEDALGNKTYPNGLIESIKDALVSMPLEDDDELVLQRLEMKDNNLFLSFTIYTRNIERLKAIPIKDVPANWFPPEMYEDYRNWNIENFSRGYLHETLNLNGLKYISLQNNIAGRISYISALLEPIKYKESKHISFGRPTTVHYFDVNKVSGSEIYPYLSQVLRTLSETFRSKIEENLTDELKLVDTKAGAYMDNEGQFAYVSSGISDYAIYFSAPYNEDNCYDFKDSPL